MDGSNKYLFQVWNSDRSLKTSCVSPANIQLLLQKAQSFGINGDRICLEKNGTLILEDEALEMLVQKEEIFMVLKAEDRWMKDIMDFSLLNESFEPSSIISFPLQNLPSQSTTDTESTVSTSSTTFEKFVRYKINWDKMPEHVMLRLNSKEKLDKLLDIFVHIIADDLRFISQHVPMTVIRDVAKSAAELYPESFIEKDVNGRIISLTPSALITKLKNRINYLNKPHNRPKQMVNMPQIPFKKRRKASELAKTCTNWHPTEKPETLEENEENLKERLIKLYGNENGKDQHLILEYMRKTFSEQRLFFNNFENIPSVQDIRDNWPFIFQRECLRQHFSLLLKVKHEIFLLNFEKHKEKIAGFLKCGSTDEKIMEGLFKYFKESEEDLYKYFEFGTTNDDICAKSPLTNTPWIAILCDSLCDESSKTYIILNEKTQVAKYNTGQNIFLNCLIDVICFFYIFNIEYPRSISLTLEFLVRFLYEYYPVSIRGKKKTIHNISKINNLITKLSAK